jgi:hypothetical protein
MSRQACICAYAHMQFFWNTVQLLHAIHIVWVWLSVNASRRVTNRTCRHPPINRGGLDFLGNICPGVIFMTCSASNNASGQVLRRKGGGTQGTQLQVSCYTANVPTSLHMRICAYAHMHTASARHSHCVSLTICERIQKCNKQNMQASTHSESWTWLLREHLSRRYFHDMQCLKYCLG